MSSNPENSTSSSNPPPPYSGPTTHHHQKIYYYNPPTGYPQDCYEYNPSLIPAPPMVHLQNPSYPDPNTQTNGINPSTLQYPNNTPSPNQFSPLPMYLFFLGFIFPPFWLLGSLLGNGFTSKRNPTWGQINLWMSFTFLALIIIIGSGKIYEHFFKSDLDATSMQK